MQFPLLTDEFHTDVYLTEYLLATLINEVRGKLILLVFCILPSVFQRNGSLGVRACSVALVCASQTFMSCPYSTHQVGIVNNLGTRSTYLLTYLPIKPR